MLKCRINGFSVLLIVLLGQTVSPWLFLLFVLGFVPFTKIKWPLSRRRPRFKSPYFLIYEWNGDGTGRGWAMKWVKD